MNLLYSNPGGFMKETAVYVAAAAPKPHIPFTNHLELLYLSHF